MSDASLLTAVDWADRPGSRVQQDDATREASVALVKEADEQGQLDRGDARARMHFMCVEFLNHEAEILDENRMEDWLELVDKEIEYIIPMRITRERTAGLGFSDEGAFLDADWEMLKVRVARLATEYAWAEDPPSRTRRLVTNVRVDPAEDPSFINVRSNFLLYRGRYDFPEYNVLCGERLDVLRVRDNGLALYKRVVRLDQTTLSIDNLALFL